MHSEKLALRVFLAAALFFTEAAGQILPGEGVDLGLGGQNIVAGSVFSSSGERIMRRIQIRISTATRGDRIGMTDEKGNFVFRGVPNGSYILLIDKEKDFEPFSQAFDVIQLRGAPGQTYMFSIRLTPKVAELPKAAVVNAEYANVPKIALDYYSKGVELAKIGDSKGAIEQFNLAIKEHPTFFNAFNELGVLYMKFGENELADAAFQSALNIKSDAFAPMMNRGIVLVNMRKFADAEKVLQDVVRLKDQEAVAHYFLGQALANLGKFDEAEKELNTAVRLGGEPAAQSLKEAHRILAIIYSLKGDKARQIIALETYLRLAPTAPDADHLKQLVLKLKG